MKEIIRDNGLIRVIYSPHYNLYKVQVMCRGWKTNGEFKSLRGATNRYEKLVNKYGVN